MKVIYTKYDTNISNTHYFKFLNNLKKYLWYLYNTVKAKENNIMVINID